MKPGPVSCQTCGYEWPRDPVLEVECPTCHAKPGKPCRVIRPSGHVHTPTFSGLPAFGHVSRDLYAAQQDMYGCGCGITPFEAAEKLAAFMAGEQLPVDPKAAQAHDPQQCLFPI